MNTFDKLKDMSKEEAALFIARLICSFDCLDCPVYHKLNVHFGGTYKARGCIHCCVDYLDLDED